MLTHISKETFATVLKNSSTRCTFYNEIKIAESQNYESYNWISGDAEKIFHKNMQDPVRRERLISNGFADQDGNCTNNITYKINKQGFRSQEFSAEPGIACFGCSYTYGIGLPEEHTWTGLLSDLTNLPTYNLGTPAFGLDLGAFYAVNWLDQDLPNLKAICALAPPPDRTAVLAYSSQTKNLQLQTIKSQFQDHDRIKPECLDDYITMIHLTGIMSHQYAVNVLKYIAKARDIPFILIDGKNNLQKRIFLPTDTNARDLAHWGVNINRNLSNHIYKVLSRIKKYNK